MSIPPLKIGIPVINRGDLLEACVASMDAPVERVVIIANRWGAHYEASVEAALNRLAESHPPCIGSLEIIETGGNLGVAGSYNFAMQTLGPCVIASNDTRFAPGTLARCGEFMAARGDHAMHFLFSMGVFSAPQIFSDEVGWFDENFWPWGWDDIDVKYRMRKRGLKTASLPREMGTIFHDHPTQSIFGSPEPLRKWMQRMSGRNMEYGMKKWGIREEHCFMLNKADRWAIDPAVLTDAGNGWTLDEETRRQRIALLKEETGIETPLIFCRSTGR